MTYDQILQSVKKGDFAPVYLFHGPEAYYIDRLEAAVIEHALTEAERAFNQTIVYGKEVDHLAVVDAARRFPMMAQRQLVVIREAQEMRSLNDLLSYVEKPAPTTILVISYKHKKLPGNTKLGKSLKKSAVVFEAKPLYDNQVPGWISSYLKGKKYPINTDASDLLAEYLGTNLSKISNELDKMLLSVPPGTAINTKMVEDLVGISRDYNVFELQRAIGTGDIVKANRIVNYFSANPKAGPMVMAVGSLYNYFAKVYQLTELQARRAPESDILAAMNLRSNFFLREYRAAAQRYGRLQCEQVMALLREYDLKSKGVDFNLTGTPDGALLKELVYKLMHLPRRG